MNRIVVVLFGPAGAGKTTIARTAPQHFTIYDRDDPPWRNQGEAAFRQAIAQLAHDPQAKAVIIRAGATSTARTAALNLTAATHGYLIMPSKRTCHERAGHRRRHDAHTNHASIDTWFNKFDHNDGLPLWPGSWGAIMDAEARLTSAAQTNRRSWTW